MTKPVIVTRAGKGSALTWTEGDTNLENLRDATITVSDGTTSTAIDLNGTITFTAGSGISVDESSGTITIANTQSAGASTLSDLTDTTITTPSNGQTLVYDSGTSKWVNFTPSSGATTLTDLSDINVTSPSNGQFLSYSTSSSKWENIGVNFITGLSEDASPQLAANLNCADYVVSAPTLKDYKETVYSIGSNDSPTITISNGNVQSVSITSGLALPAFADAAAGQSVTLLVTGSGTASGTGAYIFAGGNKTLTTKSVVSIFYDGTTYWASIATGFVA